MAAVGPPPGLLESMSKCGKCKPRAMILPMVLSCLHSCCSECVDSLLKDTKDGLIVCPQCEKAVTARGENSFIEALSQVFATDENVPKCLICKAEGIELNATQVCLHCPPLSYYCDKCARLHNRFPNSKTHRQVTLSDFMESGSVHPHDFPVTMCACCSKAKAEVSCRSCVLSLCLKCGVARSCSKGGKHEIEDESAAVDRYRKEIHREMDKFKQNSESISEQIQETEAQLDEIEVSSKQSGLNQKEHHGSLYNEMGNQQELLRELCHNNSVEMVTALSQMTEAREVNIRGEKSGQRALDFTPEGLMGAALEDVKALPRPSPHTKGLVKTEMMYAVPDTASVANLEKHVMGSVICKKVIKSWPGESRPYICCGVTLPSGKKVIFEAANEDGLYLIDHPGNRIKIHDGNTVGICFSGRDQKVYSAVRLPISRVSILSYDLVDFDGTDKPSTEVSDVGCASCQGIAVSSSGKIALAAYSQKYVLIFNEDKKIVQKISFDEMSVGLSGSEIEKGCRPMYMAFGLTDTDLYITVVSEAVERNQAVVCLFIDYTREQVSCEIQAMSVTKPLVKWVRELDRVYTIQYMNGAVYVTTHRRSITVLDPYSGSNHMTFTPGGVPRGFRSLPSGVVEVVSYEK